MSCVPLYCTVRRGRTSRPPSSASVSERPWVSTTPMATSTWARARRAAADSIAKVLPTPGAAPRKIFSRPRPSCDEAASKASGSGRGGIRHGSIRQPSGSVFGREGGWPRTAPSFARSVRCPAVGEPAVRAWSGMSPASRFTRRGAASRAAGQSVRVVRTGRLTIGRGWRHCRASPQTAWPSRRQGGCRARNKAPDGPGWPTRCLSIGSA